MHAGTFSPKKNLHNCVYVCGRKAAICSGWVETFEAALRGGGLLSLLIHCFSRCYCAVIVLF